VVIDAHGSWERGPRIAIDGARSEPRPASRRSDVLAFKASFTGTSLARGLLPLVALPGGYAGMVVAEQGRATVAMCLRRDALERVRARHVGMSAGLAVESFLRESARGAGAALAGAQRLGPWLAVGPLRPGRRAAIAAGIHRVGNALAETHPLVGEGMRMALLSSRALVRDLLHDNGGTRAVRMRTAGSSRMSVAACLAHMAMRPRLAGTAGSLLQHWPSLLTTAARCAGKASTFPFPDASTLTR
jgi:flavin-dependent dehydrogenase